MCTPISFKKTPSQVEDTHLSHAFIVLPCDCLLLGYPQLFNLMIKLNRLPGSVHRDRLIGLLRMERPETCHWVGLDVIIRHFAQVINGFDTVALQTVLGRH